MTNGFNPASTNRFYGWDGSKYGWFIPVGGGATPGGSDGDIQFNQSGVLAGSNAFKIVFSGNNSKVTNAAGGTVTITAGGTNLVLNGRRLVWGPDGTVNVVGSTTEIYLKASQSSSALVYASASGGRLFEVDLDDSGSGGFGLSVGASGGKNFAIFNATGASSPIKLQALGSGVDLELSSQLGAVVLGTNTGNTSAIVPFAMCTNGEWRFHKNVNGGTNYMTNFVNVFTRAARMDASEHVVDSGNVNTLFINVGQWKNGGWAQEAPASNDTFHSWVDLEAGDYTFYAMGIADSNRGQQRWDLINPGGTTNSSWAMDWYNAIPALNTKKIQSVTIPKDGRYKIQSVVTNKNASSSSFYIFLTESGFTR